jgi:hypothetical protein
MRLFTLTVLIATALCACNPSAPESTSAPAVAPAPAAPVSKPAEASMPAKDIPAGECGDQGKLAPDRRLANTARWTTASEQDNFGFDVYRGDSEKGEFTKLTRDPIVGAGTSDETHKYEYRDDSIDPCKEYWYYVEGITTSGAREKFTPTFRAPPKRREVGSAAPVATPEPGVPAKA